MGYKGNSQHKVRIFEAKSRINIYGFQQRGGPYFLTHSIRHYFLMNVIVMSGRAPVNGRNVLNSRQKKPHVNE